MILDMKKNILYLFSVLLCLSCDDYLATMPDNRAESDSEEKINKLLVSAYPESDYIVCTELSSDNVDDYGSNNPYTDRFLEQVYGWQTITETDNEDPKRIWEACYGAIANANEALKAIDEMGNPDNLSAERGEALVARAYCHFILTNVFCQNYSEKYSAQDLGVPYMEAAETELDPKYERGTVLEDYEKMAKDLEEGLPLINDAIYSVPKYHFNTRAAYTFASRFYIFYQKWDKAIKYATMALGNNPASLLRDYPSLVALPRNLKNVGTQYVSTSLKTNFLVQTAYSRLGTIFGAYYTGSRFSHGALLAQMETLNNAPWGKYSTSTTNYANMYKLRPYIYSGTNLDKTLLPRLPYLFEYTDPVAQTGYSRTVYVALSAEEALLNRAEAYVMSDKYSEALVDINTWTSNTLNTVYAATPQLTEQSVVSWANSYEYYKPTAPTPKKKLNPDFLTIEAGSKQESFIHCLLYMRRCEFMHSGMRWFDIKRYGIEIHRRTVNGLAVNSVDDELKVRDNRRALQLPQDVIKAGIIANPR